MCVTTSFPRDPGDPAGHFVFSDCEARAAESDVEVIAPRPFAGAAPFRVSAVGGGELFAWPGAWARARERPLRIGGAASFLSGARAAARRLEADLLVVHWWLPSILAVLGGRRGIPIEIRAHGADVRLFERLPDAARSWIVRATLAESADLRVVFAAHDLAERLLRSLPGALARAIEARASVEAPRIDVRAAPVAGRERAEVRESLGGSYGRMFCAVGRLVPDKRFELAIEATGDAGARLVLVGDGPERARLERRAHPRVTFAGALPRPEALGVIAASDALVHPSRLEAAPSVVREARALDVPVVACAAGDLERWASSDAGIRIARPDASHIAELLRDLAS